MWEQYCLGKRFLKRWVRSELRDWRRQWGGGRERDVGAVLPGEEVPEEVGEVCSELRDWHRQWGGGRERDVGAVLPGEEVPEKVGEVCSELRDWRRQ